MNNSKLSDEIKLAKVMVTFKKDNSSKSKSYRPVIVLTNSFKSVWNNNEQSDVYVVEQCLSP